MCQSVDISICIVNWNTSDLLRDCLNSIYQLSWNNCYEVIVVDNASTDSSLEMLRIDFPQAKVIANEVNLGFARANNQAFALAKGNYILALNSDTIVLPGAFGTMKDFMDNHREAGAVGCKLLNPDGTIQRSCWHGFPNLKSAIVDAFYLWRVFPNLAWVCTSEIPQEELDAEVEVDHLLGACILVRAIVCTR